MKTHAILKVANEAVALAAIILSLSITSCANDDDDATALAEGETVTTATVAYRYTIPAQMLDYVEIMANYNNNQGTDAVSEPVLDTDYTHTYSLTKFPVTAPLVFVYEPTNRSGEGVNVDWNITVDTEVTLHEGSQTVVKTNSETYTVSGDAAAGIEKLISSTLDRTYAVRISPDGEVQFVH